MKPNPFCELKNFTVPEAILISLKERTNASADPHNHLRRPRSGFGVLGEGPLGGRSPGRLNLECQQYRDTRTDLQTSTLLSIDASSLSSVIGVSSRRPRRMCADTIPTARCRCTLVVQGRRRLQSASQLRNKSLRECRRTLSSAHIHPLTSVSCDNSWENEWPKLRRRHRNRQRSACQESCRQCMWHAPRTS